MRLIANISLAINLIYVWFAIEKVQNNNALFLKGALLFFRSNKQTITSVLHENALFYSKRPKIR